MKITETGMNDTQSGVTSILLICREGKSRQGYQAELDLPGVLLVCVQSLMQFFRREVYCPLNGILVDMPTYLRSTEEEKRLLTDLVAIFPALRLKCNESSGEIRTLPFGSTFSGSTSPAEFVKKYCSSFVQRKIRTCERTLVNMPALLNRTLPVENVSSARTVTSSMSYIGCFLVSFEPWIVGERGWLVLPELKDDTPVPVEIRSIRAWGEYRSLPGMGVKFIDLTESQKAELSRLGGQNLMQKEELIT
jgi:hypothetical protein